MGQYEIAKMLYSSDREVRFEKIQRHTGNVESSVRTSLHKLMKKDLVVEEKSGKVYKWNPEATKEDLESIRTYTIDELRD
ncbi:BlaI/MecI/CopY family transcriptional regulator [Natronosalvus halobius]|uniref:BlaI/MecI/CopY family transcriptional regulator n=1 Tax=Natronosalvus halobius TaxID=2953746 RepID=UPI00209D8FE7|nr:BlaI/MecI/CopY family transcriptional regulator [Natronosalvus halobius]USZ71263.1 BlaI/MecI/CopY family transcriptional regulator [Natronosalvus halobius]